MGTLRNEDRISELGLNVKLEWIFLRGGLKWSWEWQITNVVNREVIWEGNGMQWLCMEEDEHLGLVTR